MARKNVPKRARYNQGNGGPGRHDGPKAGGTGNRTDRQAPVERRNQPVRSAPGGPYGARQASEDAQRAMPLPDAVPVTASAPPGALPPGATPASSATPTAPMADPAAMLAAALASAPPREDLLTAPSTTPTPVTAGLPPDPGMAFSGPVRRNDRVTNLLEQLAYAMGDESLRQMAERARVRGV